LPGARGANGKPDALSIFHHSFCDGNGRFGDIAMRTTNQEKADLRPSMHGTIRRTQNCPSLSSALAPVFYSQRFIDAKRTASWYVNRCGVLSTRSHPKLRSVEATCSSIRLVGPLVYMGSTQHIDFFDSMTLTRDFQRGLNEEFVIASYAVTCCSARGESH
jgi:hypothetical protein